ncbi:Uncharacterised protein r2_g2436 [Pycnogonum litorale]
MVYKCAAFGCRSGYDGSETSPDISFHSFPFKDQRLLNIWSKKIARQDFRPSKHSKVCSLHFSPDSFVENRVDSNIYRLKNKSSNLKLRKLRPDAIPTIFENVPTYMNESGISLRKSKCSGEERCNIENMRLIDKSEKMWKSEEIKSVKNIQKFLENNSEIPSGYYTILDENTDRLMILYISIDDHVPHIHISIMVSNDLKIGVCVNGNHVDRNHYVHLISEDNHIKMFSQVLNLMAFFKSWLIQDNSDHFLENAVVNMIKYAETVDTCDKQDAARFLGEQIKLLSQPKSARRYTSSTIIFSYLLHAISSSAYREIINQKLLTLPSERTLRNVTRTVGTKSTPEYLRLRFAGLDDTQKHVVLMLDEIYTAKRMEYSSSTGKIYGITDECHFSKTLLCFMVKSLTSNYKDIVGLFPIDKLNVSKLSECVNNIFKMLDELGFNVIVLCADNHVVNRSYFKTYLCDGNLRAEVKNPINKKPLFLLFDPVHNFKNIYNNFVSKKVLKFPNFSVNSSDPLEVNCACFYHIVDHIASKILYVM